MKLQEYDEIVVWGLKNRRHSHRFIHEGFFNNFHPFARDVVWVNDRRGIEFSPFKKRMIFASGMASRHLPIVPNTEYVFHNLALTEKQKFASEVLNSKILYLQVHTNSSRGEKLWESPFISFDVGNKTLTQPWGTPIPEPNWYRNTAPLESSIEYWVGAVWNNALNQGNIEAIEAFKKSLSRRNVDFKRIGGSRLNLNGISDQTAVELVRKSRIGASILGRWQMEQGYIPCRVFKNLSAGIPPISNGDFRLLFGASQLYAAEIDELVDVALSESRESRMTRLEESQALTGIHTYRANIKRIIQCLSVI
jgi:hypothetical protein